MLNRGGGTVHGYYVAHPGRKGSRGYARSHGITAILRVNIVCFFA